MASERRVVRFCGPRGDLLVADTSGIAVCDSSGGLRYRIALDGVVDAVAVGAELWAVAREGLVRMAIADGEILSTERVPGLHALKRLELAKLLHQRPFEMHGLNFSTPRVSRQLTQTVRTQASSRRVPGGVTVLPMIGPRGGGLAIRF